MAKKPTTLRPTSVQKVTSKILTLEAIEDKDILIPSVEIRKGDFGATATFTAVTSDNKSVTIRTYSWSVIQALMGAQNEDCYPIVTRFSLVNGKWMIVDPEKPELFNNWTGDINKESAKS